MSTAVEIFYGDNAEVRKTLLKLLQFIAGEHIIFPALGTPRHDGKILASSPNFRLISRYPPSLLIENTSVGVFPPTEFPLRGVSDQGWRGVGHNPGLDAKLTFEG